MNDSEPHSEWTYRSARDQNLSLRERVVSPTRESSLFGTGVRVGCNLAARAYLAGMHRLEVTGRQNLPIDPPFVLIANHSSHLDAMLLESILPGRLWGSVFAIAAGDTFFTNVPHSVFAAGILNALPMWRHRRSAAHTLETLRSRLCEDAIGLIFFPEGTRSRTGEIGPFKAGIGMLVAETSVPVIPACIHGAYESWPPQNRWPRPNRVRVRLGEPLHFQNVPSTKSGWLSIADELRNAVLRVHEESATLHSDDQVTN